VSSDEVKRIRVRAHSANGQQPVAAATLLPFAAGVTLAPAGPFAMPSDSSSSLSGLVSPSAAQLEFSSMQAQSCNGAAPSDSADDRYMWRCEHCGSIHAEAPAETAVWSQWNGGWSMSCTRYLDEYDVM
jgi:hypothetical protein